MKDARIVKLRNSFWEEKNKSPEVSGVVFTLKMYINPSLKMDFEGNFHYLSKSNFMTINLAELLQLIHEGHITPVKQTVRSLTYEPDLFNDGFECRFLPDHIQAILAEYKASSSDEYRSNLRNKLRKELETLLSNHFGLKAVALDTVYRNTDEKVKNVFKSVPMIHIDFPETKPYRTLASLTKEWSPRVLAKGQQYDANNIELMVNIWMPLDVIVASPLALCSRKKTDASRLHEYDAVRRDGSKFHSVGMTPPLPGKNDPWFYKPGMKGQCYMFNSRRGIHSATEFPGEKDTRESIEIRLGLFKN